MISRVSEGFTVAHHVFVQGSPQMLRQQGCVYLFEWATPIVCPDTTQTDNCQLTDTQLQFTFDLSTLSGEVQVSSIDTFGLYPHCCCGRVVFKNLRLLCFRSQSALASTTSMYAARWQSQPVTRAPSAGCQTQAQRSLLLLLASARS